MITFDPIRDRCGGDLFEDRSGGWFALESREVRKARMGREEEEEEQTVT